MFVCFFVPADHVFFSSTVLLSGLLRDSLASGFGHGVLARRFGLAGSSFSMAKLLILKAAKS